MLNLNESNYLYQCLQVLRSIINDWSGFTITKTEKNSGTKYKLIPLFDSFITLVHQLKPIAKYQSLLTNPLQLKIINTNTTQNTHELQYYTPIIQTKPLTLHVIK